MGELYLLLDLLLAIVLGFCIGYERKLRAKEAGIRTHTVVCFGVALMMIISKYAFKEADTARVAAQIVAGVGFLGAGMIVYRKNQVHGLTTAAGVWATAGIGMACGGELYILSIGATVILITAQSLFHVKTKIFESKKYYLVKIEFNCNGNENDVIKSIFGVDRFNHLVIKRNVKGVIYSATLNTDIEFRSSTLNEIIQNNDFIISIERCDD